MKKLLTLFTLSCCVVLSGDLEIYKNLIGQNIVIPKKENLEDKLNNILAEISFQDFEKSFHQVFIGCSSEKLQNIGLKIRREIVKEYYGNQKNNDKIKKEYINEYKDTIEKK